MKLPIFIIHFFLFGWALTSCQHKQSDPQPDPQVPIQGTPTLTGKPIGNPVSKVIGPAGGRISTPDNIFTLVIPAGAITKDTTVSIQPVENKTWSGTGQGYDLSPQNLELLKPASITWNYTDAQLEGSVAEALGVSFQQSDRTWKGRKNVTIDKAEKRASTTINKLLPTAFYESYYMVPAKQSVVPGEYLDLKVYFHAGHQDDGELAPLTLPELLTKEQVKNWKLNGFDATGTPDPQRGTLGKTGKGASATYVAPNRVPSPNEVVVSVEVEIKSKSKLILLSNIVIEAANAFQFGAVRTDSAQVATISVVDGDYFHISLSERDLTDERQAVVSLSMLPFPGVGEYQLTENSLMNVSATDRERKSWSDSYYPSTGKKVTGPLTVSILEYDKVRRRVRGKISGTLHYYDRNADHHKTAQISARFNAATPY